MSTSGPAPGWVRRARGWVYLIHFRVPLFGPGRPGARHYTGWTDRPAARMAEHAAGNGARIMWAVKAAGIEWALVELRPGTQADEWTAKNHGAARRCPVCTGRISWEAAARGLVLAA